MKNTKETNRNYRIRLLNKIREFYSQVGEECFFCKSINRLSCHRKDFSPHKRIAHLSIAELKKENKNDYARVCFQCNYGVHWAHNILKMSWEEIIYKFRT